MLGLGGNLTLGGDVVERIFTPESLSNIAVWLKVGTNMTADQNNGGGAVSHSTDAGDMYQADRINFWGAAGSTSINATQTDTTAKPRWSTTTGELGGVASANANKHMHLSSNITFAADTDFTIVIRFRINDFDAARAFLGNTTSEFFALNDENTIQVKTDGTESDFDSDEDLQVDKTATIIMTRSNGADGIISIHVRGEDSSYFDTATGVPWGDEVEDAEEIVISKIMASDDDTIEFDGTFMDVIIYNGTAVSPPQRKELFDYLEAQ